MKSKFLIFTTLVLEYARLTIETNLASTIVETTSDKNALVEYNDFSIGMSIRQVINNNPIIQIQ